LPEIKQQAIEMALKGSGVRDTARVLGISTATVINELKKAPELQSVNHAFLEVRVPERIQMDIVKAEGSLEVAERKQAVEMDEMWSYVGCKANQRW
jgi:hypothetical protein